MVRQSPRDDAKSRSETDKLKASEARLNLALKASRMGVWEWDALSGEVTWSKELKKLYGLKANEKVDYKKYISLIHPGDREATKKIIDAAQKSGKQYRVEHRIVRPDGSIHWVLGQGQAFIENGKVVRMLGTTMDIDQQKANEEQHKRQSEYLEVLNDTAVKLSRGITNPLGILKTILRRAAKLIDTDNGYIYLQNADKSALVVRVGIGVFKDHVGHTIRSGEGIAGKVWQTGTYLTVEDYDTWSGRQKKFPRGFLKSGIGIPLRSGGETVGVIALGFSRYIRSFSDEEITVLTRLADIASIALDNAALYRQAQTELQVRKMTEEMLQLERARLQNLFQQAPLAISVLKGPEYVIEVVNPAMCRLWGKEYEDIINKPLLEAIPEIKGQGFLGLLRGVTRTGKPYIGNEMPAELVSDGKKQTVYFNFTYQPIRDDNGSITGVIAVAADVNEQVRLRLETEKSETRLRFMAEAMPQKIFTADSEGNIDYYNPQWMEFTGLSFDQMRDWGWTQFVHPDDLDENIRRWKHSLDTGEDFETEHRFRRHDGVYRWHISRAKALQDDKGKIMMWVGSNTDIDDIKETLSKKQELEAITLDLQNQRQELMELNSAKDEFISLASHQLRTPATGVKQFVGMLLEDYFGKLSEDQRTILEYAYESNERQLQVINDLLKVAQVDAGKVVLTKSRCDLAELLEDIMQEQRSQFAARKQRVVLDRPDEPVYANIDATRIRMVAENLIDNASKYTPENKRITVSINQISSANKVEIKVKDEGVGIAQEDIVKLFQKFSRLENPLSIQVGGTGIGLYWAKKIVDLHDGTIDIKSKPGKGTTFIVRIPT